MTNDRLIILLYNSIICLEEFGIKGEKLEFEIGISEDEYKKVMEEYEEILWNFIIKNNVESDLKIKIRMQKK